MLWKLSDSVIKVKLRKELWKFKKENAIKKSLVSKPIKCESHLNWRTFPQSFTNKRRLRRYKLNFSSASVYRILYCKYSVLKLNPKEPTMRSLD